MKNILKEIYAILELRDNEILFLVGMYYKSEIRVLYKKSVQTSVGQNGIITDKARIGNCVRKIIDEANKFLGIDIKRVIFIPPEKQTKINIFKTKILIPNNRNILKEDVDQIISKVKSEASFEKTRYVYFIRPFKYYLDNGREMYKPPIGFSSQKLKLKSIIYSLPINIWISQMKILKYANLERQSIVPRGHVLGTEIASFNKLKIGLNIIEWNKNSIMLNSFVSGVLAKQIEIPDHYDEWLIKPIVDKLDCKPSLAKMYIENFVKLKSKYNNNLVIYSKLSRNQNKYIKFTLQEFNFFVEELIIKELQKIDYSLNTILQTKDLPIIYIGEITNIGGIRNLLLKPGKNVSIHNEQNMAGNEIWLTPLVGAIHHQHIVNKQLGYTKTAVDNNEQFIHKPLLMQLPNIDNEQLNHNASNNRQHQIPA
ncbi:hypothetical protein [Spiroplasma endosymbiont of Amphibalanus improvisus]|uniref:hypothetical protein n=1 Tax=Spiroplasma endosymbiont of Amphibalanus improvisus TaxID=3066327 RepID=UPI00313D5C98